MAKETSGNYFGQGSKKGFLVLGPESCGNRLVTRLLVAAGCFGDGQAGRQRLDSGIPQRDGVTPIVWLRSIPHGGQWPDVREMARKLRGHGYDVVAVVPTRDWTAVIPSQVRAGHCRSEKQAWSNLQRAYPFIFGALAEEQIPFVVVSYESLVQRPRRAVEKFIRMINLPIPAEFERIVDQNRKWFTE